MITRPAVFEYKSSTSTKNIAWKQAFLQAATEMTEYREGLKM